MLGLGTLVPGGGLNVENARTYCGPIREDQRIGHGELLVALTDLTQDGIILGAPGIVPTSWAGEFVVSTDVAKVHLSEPESLDVRFLYYLMRSQEFRDYARGVSTGTTVRRVSPGDILAFNACLPPLAEQRAIARVLGTLDDKIELNRLMNQTLEGICRALFKFWFVDFGPVHAKTEGRWKKGENLPGMPADMWDLWPSDFEESEIGEIPKGWKTGPLSDLATPLREAVDPQVHPGERFDHYSIPAYDAGRLPKIEAGSQIHSFKLLVPDCAVLVSRLNPRIPRVWAAIGSEGRRGIASTEFLVLLPKAPVSSSFLWGACSSATFLETLAGLVTGTSGSHQRVLPDDTLAISTITPPTEILTAFEERVVPLFRQMAGNLRESVTLSSTRDALLPKLLSGEIRVKVDT